MGVNLQDGNIDRMGVVQSSINVASVAANTTAEQTFTVTGLRLGDMVLVSKPSLSAGLGLVNARVSANDTLALTFSNSTAGAIDPAAETYTIAWFRPYAGMTLPTAVLV